MNHSLCAHLFRWKWSRTFSTTSSVTSAKVHAVEASLRRSSVPASLACSITVSSVGCRFTHGLDVSTTNLSSRRVLIGRGHYHSAGAESAHRLHQAFTRCIAVYQYLLFLRVFNGFFLFLLSRSLIYYCIVLSFFIGQFNGSFIHWIVLKSSFL